MDLCVYFFFFYFLFAGTLKTECEGDWFLNCNTNKNSMSDEMDIQIVGKKKSTNRIDLHIFLFILCKHDLILSMSWRNLNSYLQMNSDN